ncbi:helix-turn-helix transcriptional regulator [Gryllotalpicola reticulitermitis]|uniref:Helix-turn-helix transcriptional regulator n=1 Tax=Gryllotalpicola reticulitermitis TaxID=1184153 RepID=A0ABV8QCU6_9MICO
MADSRSDEPDYEALRLHLSRLRHERGWSYDDLAARTGIGRSTLVTLESGKPRRNPGREATRGSLDTWFRLARAFEMDLGELLLPLTRQESDPSHRHADF